MPDAGDAEENAADEALRLDADIAEVIRRLGSNDRAEHEQALSDLRHLLPIMRRLARHDHQHHQQQDGDER